MTVKLTVCYGRPEDAEAFERHYFDVHVPIVARYPGLQRTELSRVTGAPGGGEAPYHLVAEMYFADAAVMQQALTSEPGRESARDFRSFAPPGTVMLVSDVLD